MEEKLSYRRSNFSSMGRNVRGGRIPLVDKSVCRKKPTSLLKKASISSSLGRDAWLGNGGNDEQVGERTKAPFEKGLLWTTANKC
jgi:hypothetical protein